MAMKIKPIQFTFKNGCCCTVRSVDEDDAENLFAYFKEIMKDDRFFILTPDDQDAKDFTLEKEKEWLKQLQQQGSIGIIAQINSQIIGMVHVNNYTMQRIRHIGVLTISILPGFRDQALGSFFMQTILDWGKLEPVIEKISLVVHSNNDRAIHLYRKFGFIEEGRKIKEIKFAPDQYIDSIMMYKFVKD
jgi:RimJ/RimL family protein N-acetyltransferase